jgi:hypothetical protein
MPLISQYDLIALSYDYFSSGSSTHYFGTILSLPFIEMRKKRRKRLVQLEATEVVPNKVK